jgi:flagellar assembly protein FliH
MPADPKNEAKSAIVAEPFLFGSPGGENGGTSTKSSGWSSATPSANANNSEAVRQAVEKGATEGEARARANYENTLAGLREGLNETVRQFALQRESYFERVEGEVVLLALSIARKILHREAQIDPLLLTGIVRVALDTLNEGTQVRLRTNPQEVLLWRDYFTHTNGLARIPEIVGDASLQAGRCVLETDLGSTSISLDTQLKEIEQGFLDLLKHRPRLPE